MILPHTLSAEVRAALAAAEALHASPTFVLAGPRTRGRFAARRQTRARRADDYRARSGVRSPDIGECLQAFAAAWCSATRLHNTPAART